jgi:hypothetical protein
MKITIIVSIAGLLMLTSHAVLAAEPGADQAMDQMSEQAPVSSLAKRTDIASKYPIEVPVASELMPRFRELMKARPHVQAKEAESETPQQQLLRRLIANGMPVALPREQCFRSIPTRNEFLRMVRKNPADANQLRRRCNLDLRGISPLPQLPVGNRQLPVDKRLRPVGTWNN